MTVYGVYDGCKYEGGNIVAIFSTREKAREYALAVISNHDFYSNLNHQASQLRGWGRTDLNSFEETKPDCWEDKASQIVTICEYIIDELTPPFIKLEEEKARSLKHHYEMIEDLKEGE